MKIKQHYFFIFDHSRDTLPTIPGGLLLMFYKGVKVFLDTFFIVKKVKAKFITLPYFYGYPCQNQRILTT